jgi:hypothetical protein
MRFPVTTAFLSPKFVHPLLHGPGSDLRGLVRAEMIICGIIQWADQVLFISNEPQLLLQARPSQGGIQQK